MGRTSATTRDQLDALEREWTPFRRSLRRRHQPAFDRLFEHARGHAEAATQQNPADPWSGFVFAVLLAQEREIGALREEITALQDDLDDLCEERDALQDDRDELHGAVAANASATTTDAGTTGDDATE